MKKCVCLALVLLPLLLAGASARTEELIAASPTPSLIPVVTPSPTPPERLEPPWRYVVGPTGVTITGYTGRDAELTVPEKLLATLTLEQAYALYRSSDTDAELRAQLILQQPDIASLLVHAQGEVQLLLPVVAIGDAAFLNNRQLRSVFIPDCVKKIGKEAFSRCVHLDSVRLPEGLVTIERHTFERCIRLSRIEIPSTVTSIGYGAFSYCSRLTSVRLPERIYSVGSRAFYKCLNLADIYIPPYLENLGTRAFYATAWLNAQTDEFVVVGRGILIRYNGKNAAVYVPSNVRAIVDAFMDNQSLQSVSMSDSVENIGYSAFSGCRKLSQARLSGEATEIQDYAFQDCTSLVELRLPEKLESIGEGAFSYCVKLAVCDIPQTVRSIGASAFERCAALVRAQIPLGVTSLGEKTFASCRALAELTLPRTLMSVAADAFFGVRPTAYVWEGSYAEAYAHAKGFDCVIVSDAAPTPVAPTPAPRQPDAPRTASDVAGFSFAAVGQGVALVGGPQGTKAVELPSACALGAVTAVGTGAFAGREGLLSVTVPEGYLSIADGAFSAMGGQVSFVLPGSLTSIGARAFAGTDAVLIAPAGSAAERYARSAGLLFVPKR